MMKSSIKYLIFLVSTLFLLTSCASMQSAKMVPDTAVNDLSPRYLAGELSSDVDGWVLLLDASLSMRKKHEEYVKFDIAKAVAQKITNTLPPISSQSGLRTFGHAPQLSSKQTQLFYGMAEFDRSKMQESLSKVTPPGGPTPMSAAIKEAAQDLKNIKGNKAIIIISDGEDLDGQPVVEAKNMLAQLDGELCIYTVHVGDNQEGRQVMENIASVTPCGFVTSALDIVPATPMANYVADVFLTGKEMGLGYHKAVSLIKPLSNIHFDYDDHSLTQEGKSILDKNIQVLVDNPSIKLTIEGHASAKGSEVYNQTLSEKRALSVRKYLMSKGKISYNRLTTVGFGNTQPLVLEADPDEINSPEARTNMRVNLKVIYE